MHEEYDKFNSIESIDGALYDAQGKKLKSVKKSDISDESGAGSDLASDDRIKSHQFYYKVYPYTVTYDIETESSQSMFLPGWRSQWALNLAVESSEFTVIVPEAYEIRYRGFNTSEPTLSRQNNKKQYYWHAGNISALNRIIFFPGWKHFAPYVLLGPTQFQIEDYKGNMSDWKEYGKFQTVLNSGRDLLPPPIKLKVHELVDGLPTTEEKVFKLYQYLQQNTTYISIQLGIGGWRPLEAGFVATKGYGDCKALSNYMYSLLKEAGIKSYYTIIRAGEGAEDVVEDFVISRFNHIILCVPNQKDTIWLECTSQTKSPGYMGSFTGNRHALLITEDGGKLVLTPRYTYKDNMEWRKVQGVLDVNGNLTADVETTYKAEQQDDLQMLFREQTQEDVKKYLKSRFSLATYDIDNYEYKEVRGQMPLLVEKLHLQSPNFATVSSRRLFVEPNVITKWRTKLPQDEERKYDLDVSDFFTDIDTTEIELPVGYQLESAPQDLKIESKYGNYTASVKLINNKLMYYRKMEHFGGYFPAKEYGELAKFYDQIYRADRNKVVLVKKEGS